MWHRFGCCLRLYTELGFSYPLNLNPGYLAWRPQLQDGMTSDKSQQVQ